MYKSEENPEKREQQKGQEESNLDSNNENDTRQKLNQAFLLKTIIDKLNDAENVKAK